MNNLRHISALLIVFLHLSICTFVFAQSPSQSPSNRNVDSYSDAEIKEVMQKAQASGMSDAQLIQQARSTQQMSAEQAQKLQSRINDIRRRDNSSSGSSSDTTQQSGRQLAVKDTNKNSKEVFTPLQSKIFGASLFRNSVNNSFEPNLKLATPLNYTVGPDDRLIINVYGKSLINWDLPVSAEGNILIPGIGILKVAGRTIEQATSAIKARLVASNYAIGNGTNVEVNLGNIRSVKVILQGELMKPGTYTLPSLSTMFNALYLARGPNDIGSFRKIQLIRGNKIIRTLDLYDFLSKGDRKDDISLRDQDIIRVPPYDKRVELRGEVKVTALFETLPDETLQDLIGFAGGFTDQAYTARIKAVTTNGRQRRIIDVLEEKFKSHIPSRGDIYTIDRILDRIENRVTIQGAIFRPGEFELQNGLTVSQLIKNAGGLREDAFSGRGSIIRLNQDNSKQQLSFNIADVLTGKSADVLLQREDSVIVSSVFELRDKYKVTVKGEVRKPGDFSYADSMQVSDLIIRAGGLAEGASSKRITVSRRIFNGDPTLKNSVTAEVFHIDIDGTLVSGNVNFVLKPYDIVSIYASPGYEIQKFVKIEGEVMYPGPYPIERKSEKISDLIAKAGGLTASADIEGSSLKRDNDAVLGVDKNKIDTAALNKERVENLKRLQNTYKDETGVKKADTDSIPRNNFIGINLKKILQRPGTNEDLILENGDVLRVPKQQQIVTVNGEVLYPSAVVYTGGKGFKGYVLNAGGYTPKALKRGAFIRYANGTVKGTRSFLFFNFHPKVKAGSEIFVPKKPVSTTNTAQAILGYTSALASLAVIIVTLFKK